MSHFLSLRWRLFLTYVPLVLFATAMLAAYLLVVMRGLYVAGIEDQMAGQARLVASSVAPQWDNQRGIDLTVKRLGLDAGNRITIIAADGTVLGDSEANPATIENHADRPEVRQILAMPGGTVDGRAQRRITSTGNEFIFVAVPIDLDGQTVGVARVARPLDEINAQLQQLRVVAFLGVVASGLVAMVLSLLLARYITYPINVLTGLAQALAVGQLDRRSEPRSADEIGRLERAFNRMADEMQDTISLISEERSKLAAILETMDDGLLMIDDQGAIILANSAAERILGTAATASRRAGATDLRGLPFIEVARDHELAALVRAVLAEGRPQARLIEYGRRRTLRAVVAPIHGVAESLVLLVLQDLTALRRLESTRRDFVANISHELRTPLASVKALVETLADGAIEDPSVARHFLHQVGEEIDHLTGLVRELLQLSQIESGQVSLRREPITPDLLVTPTVERLRAQAERAGLTLTVGPLENLPPVLADPDRIGQVLLNLIHNAIKFTPPGGEVAVTASVTGEELAVAVRDTGTGIDPDDLPRIFERFYKADKARSSGGTGLGLAISKHLIGAHGGTLTAENNVQRSGATFTFTLPLAAPRTEVNPQALAGDGGSRSRL